MISDSNRLQTFIFLNDYKRLILDFVTIKQSVKAIMNKSDIYVTGGNVRYIQMLPPI